jgi:GNAT superfamily N-acetyltransferase
MADGIEHLPLTKNNWHDFEKLLGPKGGCGGCWCMTWRFRKAEYEKRKGEENKKAIRNLVENAEPIGVLTYVKNEPAAWCAIAPREKYPRLEKSRVLKRIDNIPVWSVSCFFVAKPFRRKGLSVQILKAALKYAGEHGATVVEGYPVLYHGEKIPDVFAWTGFLQTFQKAGFKEMKRFSMSRPIMRYHF